VSFWIDVACSESRLIWCVVSMILWMGFWHGLSAISSGSCIKCIICFRDVSLVETGGGHGLLLIIKTVWLKNIS
jgi:hypothetical protein